MTDADTGRLVRLHTVASDAIVLSSSFRVVALSTAPRPSLGAAPVMRRMRREKLQESQDELTFLLSSLPPLLQELPQP